MFENYGHVSKELLNSIYGKHTHCRKCKVKLDKLIYRIPVPIKPAYYNGFPDSIDSMYPNIIFAPVYLCNNCMNELMEFLGMEVEI